MRATTRAVVAAAAVALAAAVAPVALAAAPRTTSPPTIQGTFEAGRTLTATTGSWANSPTSFAYRWQRCTSSGTGCASIAGATAKTYRLAAADVGRTVRVLVTAANADGKATANSHPSPIISDSTAPRNAVRPAISGVAQAGETLAVSNGTWTGGVTSFAYQWLRCDVFGGNCTSVAGATGKSYGVREADVGMTIRAAVTARNLAGATTVTTDRSEEVQEAGSTTTVVTTTEAARPPSIRFLSLKVRGHRVYARFRVCDDSGGRVTVTARAQMARRLAHARRFHVTPSPCASYARRWILLRRFRAHGHRFVVTLRAADSSGLLSRLASRSVRIR